MIDKHDAYGAGRAWLQAKAEADRALAQLRAATERMLGAGKALSRLVDRGEERVFSCGGAAYAPDLVRVRRDLGGRVRVEAVVIESGMAALIPAADDDAAPAESPPINDDGNDDDDGPTDGTAEDLGLAALVRSAIDPDDLQTGGL